MSESKDRYLALDVAVDNQVVAAKGAEIQFKRDERLTPGYTARFQDSRPFSPRKMLLHDKSNKILMLTPERKSRFVRIDTETGKNVGEVTLKFHSEVEQPIDTIVPIQKFSQLQPSEVVAVSGVSRNTIFNLHWDPRQKGDDVIVKPDERFTKATKGFKFTAIATNQMGDIVAGSADGHIRLFQEGPLKRPKTHLNQLSDPVIGVDVSTDGQWVIWTTKEYLAVVNVTFENDENLHICNGFHKSMPEKPNALLLRIPEEEIVAHQMGDVNLTPARFDNGPYVGAGVIEEEIVTSSGPFIIRWKFRQVKLDYAKGHHSGNLLATRPTIYRQSASVVDKTFEYGRNNVIVVLEISKTIKV